MYAQTVIKCNGEVIDYGAEIDEGDFDEDIWNGLVEVGAVGDLPPSVGNNAAFGDEIARRDAEIARLRALLAEEGVEDEGTPLVDDVHVDEVTDFVREDDATGTTDEE